MDAARVTVSVYVLVVVPFGAVTMVVIALAPNAKAIEPDALPELTAVPFTFTVAVGSLVVGVIVMEATLLATLAL